MALTSFAQVTTLRDAQLLRLLECPICIETCTKKIYMCINGHITCETCQEKLDSCGICRTPGKPAARCNPLEQIMSLIVEVPCKYAKFGCPLKFTKSDMEVHLPTCEYGLECLICMDYRGSANQLTAHVARSHAQNYFIVPVTRKITLKCIDLDSVADCFVCMFVFNWASFWYVWKHSSSVLTSTMRLVEDDETKASLYRFTVEYECKTRNLKASYQNEVLTLTAPAGDGAANISLPQNIVASANSRVTHCVTFQLRDSDAASDLRASSTSYATSYST